MSVNKRILDSKTDLELEEYIKIGNRFVPEAQIMAFEILKTRGYNFSEEQTKMFLNLKEKKEIEHNTIVDLHGNYKKASDFIYISGVLGILNVIWMYDTLKSGLEVFIVVFTLGFIFWLGYMLKKGTDWIRYLLLLIMVFGALSLPFMFSNIMNEPVVSFINIVQTILQFCALILLFKIPKIVK